MLNKVKELDIYIEAENANSVSEDIALFDATGSAYVSDVKTYFNGTDYIRISTFVTEKNQKRLIKYLENSYGGNAIIVE